MYFERDNINLYYLDLISTNNNLLFLFSAMLYVYLTLIEELINDEQSMRNKNVYHDRRLLFQL